MPPTRVARSAGDIVVLGAVFTLARFSEAFLLLRAPDLRLATAHVPAILITSETRS